MSQALPAEKCHQNSHRLFISLDFLPLPVADLAGERPHWVNECSSDGTTTIIAPLLG